MGKKRVLNIFFEGLKIYCFNIHKFLLYMLFPVLGQILGLFLIFAPVFWLTQNMQNLQSKFNFLNEISGFLLFLLLITVPGLLIFLKAFWEYLIAYGSVNSMTEGYLNTGKVYDFKSHREVVLNKTFSFVAVWILFGLFALISFIPVFWIIGLIFFIYFILLFQVFTFENGLSPIGYFRRSLELIKGYFVRTFILAIILFIFTYYVIPAGLSVIFEAVNVTAILSKGLEAWVFTLPIEPLEPYGATPAIIANAIASQIIFFLAIGLTLPFRSICWTLWYNNLSDVQVDTDQPKNKKSKSNKGKNLKIENREIDPEIIRRARLEDDEY